MAVTITPDDIREIISTPLPDDVIQSYIDCVSEADTCLDANGVPDSCQKIIKTNAVAHLIEVQQRGSVTSEKDAPGNSRSYNDLDGLASTSYGQVVKSLDKYGCIDGVIGGTGGKSLWLRAVG